RPLVRQPRKHTIPAVPAATVLSVVVLAVEDDGYVEAAAVGGQCGFRAADEFAGLRCREAVADEHPKRVRDVVTWIAWVGVIEVDDRDGQPAPPNEVPRSEVTMADHVLAERVVVTTQQQHGPGHLLARRREPVSR